MTLTPQSIKNMKAHLLQKYPKMVPGNVLLHTGSLIEILNLALWALELKDKIETKQEIDLDYEFKRAISS